ncbi:hypothetical protein LCGC14_1939370 [marine sediment metagenome]|uniref:BppU N-terminal domain-containing protein n=1 Tax=marine sediment metagenome TaxID=412755 RepID=A0A0F9II49_9ZZZZ
MPWAGKLNETLIDDFVVVDSSGNLVPGLVQGNFTIQLYNPSGVEVSGSISVTIIEVGDGNYRTSFIPNVIGDWLLVIKHTTYFAAGKRGQYRVFEALFDELDSAIDDTQGVGFSPATHSLRKIRQVIDGS